MFLMTWAPKNGMKIGLSQQKREAVQANLAGSYLAACILYSVIYQESPENCPYISELDQDVASKLQSIAADLVLG